MNLNNRRQSNNVNDRRGTSAGRRIGIGGGIGGVLILALITWISGGNPLSVIMSEAPNLVGTEQSYGDYQPTAEEEELAEFSSKILAGTEDVWTEIFRQNGMEYEPPTMTLFTGSVQSGCGNATAAVGPFYCSADQTLYIDLSFFQNMRRDIGADGDFAYAYVIAHEVGHHVQYLLGTLDQAHSAMNRTSETEANKISVRIELQADYYAGVWAHHDNRMFGSLEEGDVEEALNAALKIGDDYLQKKAQGYAVPESFNHGTSAQRERWLKRGLQSGSLAGGDTFSPSYNSL
ncbi:MAG: neutral zinc metallopeptidase [Clostridium sp.]|nr:neutral zinc metallopeptidase [Clostridium sp.]